MPTLFANVSIDITSESPFAYSCKCIAYSCVYCIGILFFHFRENRVYFFNVIYVILIDCPLQGLEFIHRTKMILTLTQDARKRPTNRRHCNWPIPMKKVAVDRTKMRAVIMKNLVALAQAQVQARALALDLNNTSNSSIFSSLH